MLVKNGDGWSICNEHEYWKSAPKKVVQKTNWIMVKTKVALCELSSHLKGHLGCHQCGKGSSTGAQGLSTFSSQETGQAISDGSVCLQVGEEGAQARTWAPGI